MNWGLRLPAAATQRGASRSPTICRHPGLPYSTLRATTGLTWHSVADGWCCSSAQSCGAKPLASKRNRPPCWFYARLVSPTEAQMFKSILVPIDLADTDLAKPAIATAATLSQTWSAMVRLLNVLPITPVMLAEYVPADFDTQQRRASDEPFAIVAPESGIHAARISGVVRQGG